MAREIDDSWIEEAVDRYQRITALHAEFDKALAGAQVTVRSPDGLVEVVVAADGAIRDVTILGRQPRGNAELSRSVRAAVTAAADAAAWARDKLYAETFGGYPPLRERP